MEVCALQDYYPHQSVTD